MNKVHCADAVRFIRKLPDECIDFVMTSPPYWGLRDYGTNPQVWGGNPECEHEWNSPQTGRVTGGGNRPPQTKWPSGPSPDSGSVRYTCSRCHAWRGEVGLEPDFRQYLGHLCAVFDELKRVLKPTGSAWVNLGDTYWSAKGTCFNPGGGDNSLETAKRDAYPLHRGNKSDMPWLRPKSLCQIPNRFAIAMTDRGWILRNDIIWHKPNGMPASVKDRLSNKYEHLFHFVKCRRYFYDLDAIREPHRSLHPQGRSRWASEGRTGHTSRHLLGLRKAGRSYVGHALDKNPGDVLELSSETRTLGAIISQKGAAKFPSEQGWQGHPAGGMARILRERDQRWLSEQGKNPGDFWTIATQPFAGAHFAVYPEALCEQPIRAACPPWVCIQCGLPRERITQKTGYAGRMRGGDGHPRHVPGFNLREERSPWGERPIYVTKGWTRCGCGAGFRPGIAFDPFAGAGTTLAVARRLGRSYLGCDLNRDYVRMARRRLRQVSRGILAMSLRATDSAAGHEF